VMEFMPARLSRAESDARAERIIVHFERYGFGLWAAEVRETGEFTGFVGLSVPEFKAPFMPAVEVGWRLARHHWGHGYATEGGRAALEFGFSQLGLAEIIAMTVPANARSRAVMGRLGMTRDPEADFDHPLIPEGDSMRRHVLYRLGRAA